MSEWWSGGPGYGPGAIADWLQGMVTNVAGNLRGLVGMPRAEALKHMDDFALRSLRRHLEARRADLDDIMAAVDQELQRRATEGDVSTSSASGAGEN